MKQKIIAVLVILFLYMSLGRAQFEGEINLKITHGDRSNEDASLVAVFVKNGNLMLKVDGGSDEARNSSIIYRKDNKVLWILNEQSQSYLEIPVDKNEENMAGDARKKNRSKSEKSEFHKTGKAATILGYVCDEWIVEQDDETKEIWGTSKLGNVSEGFMKSLSQMSRGKKGSMMEEWQAEMMEKKIFPLKTITKEQGTVTHIEEVTKIDERKLSASMFEPPPSYKKQSLDFDIKNMMKGMGKKTNPRHTGDTNMNNVDMDKLMKDVQEKMKQMKNGMHGDQDSTKDDDDDGDDDK